MLAGLGGIMLRFLGIRKSPTAECWLCEISLLGFAGIMTAGAIAMVINFAAPVSGLAVVGIWLLGGVGVARIPRPTLQTSILLCLLVVAVAWLNAREFRHGDTGLYHWQAVKWAASAPVVPGLANLNPWFGHNSTWWLFTAALGLPGLSAHTANLVGGTALFFSLTLLAGCLCRVWEGKAMLGDWVIVTASYLILRQGLGVNSPGVATSMAANLLILVGAYLLADSLRRPDSGMLDLALVLAAFAITVKLQALPLFLVTGSVWLARLCRRGLPIGKTPCVAGGVSAFLVGLWMLRGVLVSGYPVFPAAFLGFPSLPWALSPAKVNAYREVVGTWHLRGLESGAGFAQKADLWIANQGGSQNILFLAAAGLGFLVLCAVVVLLGRKRGVGSQFARAVRDHSLAGSGLLLAVGFGGLAYCAVLAPVFQYASGYFFIVAGVAMSAVLALADWRIWSRRVRGAALAVILVGAIVLNGGMKAFLPVNILQWPEFPMSQPDRFTTVDGLVVHYSRDGFSWDLPLPAAIAVEPGLGSPPSGTGRLPRAFFARRNGFSENR